MQPLVRRQRIAVAVWIVLGIALWNGIFEMMVVRGVKDYLFRAALHEAGRRPFTPIAEVMDPAIFHATWVATLWTSIVLLAALLTIRAFQGSGFYLNASPHPRLESHGRAPSAHRHAR